MAKIKLTANELKRQKVALSRFQQYLPTLVMKKQYLQIERHRVSRALSERLREQEERMASLEAWIAVLGEPVGLERLVGIERIETEESNVAGVEMAVFKGVVFREAPYDLYSTPPWVDRAVEEIKRLVELEAEIRLLERQGALLGEALRRASQRVNLFEKVMIPQTLENIRIIQVFLGDQQTAAVVRGKIAKAKIVRQPVPRPG